MYKNTNILLPYYLKLNCWKGVKTRFAFSLYRKKDNRSTTKKWPDETTLMSAVNEFEIWNRLWHKKTSFTRLRNVFLPSGHQRSGTGDLFSHSWPQKVLVNLWRHWAEKSAFFPMWLVETPFRGTRQGQAFTLLDQWTTKSTVFIFGMKAPGYMERKNFLSNCLVGLWLTPWTFLEIR